MSANEKKLSIQRTGEMLLSGWKMLGISCPICNTALLSNKNSDMICPFCNLPVRKESDVASASKTSTQFLKDIEVEVENELEEEEDGDGEDGDDSPIEPTSFEELKQEYDRNNKKRDLISSALGEKMLLGWTMLGEICPNSNCNGTPLMADHSGNKLCVSCNNHQTEPLISHTSSENAGAKSRPAPAPESKSTSTSVPSTSINDTASSLTEIQHTRTVIGKNKIEEKLKEKEAKEKNEENEHQDIGDQDDDDNDDDDQIDDEEAFLLELELFRAKEKGAVLSSFSSSSLDNSSLLSQKLLSGWAMLREVCGLCGTPMLRDLEGKVVCVVCSAPPSLASSTHTSSPSPSLYLIEGERSPPPAPLSTPQVFASLDPQHGGNDPQEKKKQMQKRKMHKKDTSLDSDSEPKVEKKEKEKKEKRKKEEKKREKQENKLHRKAKSSKSFTHVEEEKDDTDDDDNDDEREKRETPFPSLPFIPPPNLPHYLPSSLPTVLTHLESVLIQKISKTTSELMNLEDGNHRGVQDIASSLTALLGTLRATREMR